MGGFVNRVLRSAAEAFGDGDSNRFLEQCHEIAEAEYGGQEEEENQLLDYQNELVQRRAEEEDDEGEEEEEEEELCEGDVSRYDNLATDDDGVIDDGDDDDEGTKDEGSEEEGVGEEDFGDVRETLSEIEEDSARLISTETRATEEEEDFLTMAVQDLIERGFTSLDDESDDGMIYE